MATRWFGERVRRNEDPRLLAGQGTFVDDIQPPRLLHAAFVRSPHAHARILRIETAAAKALPRVAAVFTAADLPEGIRGPLPRLIPHPTLIHHKTQVALAETFVHHAGEPVAMVVAESRYLAEDGVDLVEVEFDPMPAVVDLDAAARPGSPTVHEDLDTNVAAQYTQRVGNVEEAFARAPHIFRERFVIDRGSSSPIETRGVVAQWDARTRYLTVWDSTQAPIRMRNFLSQLFRLPQSSIRVIAPDIGGGFGPKIMMCYPEEILIPHAAMRLGRPVKWIEDRREHFVATNHEREQIHDAVIAVDPDGRILGVRTTFLHDAGAYIAYGLIVPIVASTQLPGPYKIPNYHAEFRAVFTNKTQVSPYRGAGRPHGVFVMERLMDRVALELKIDRAELRRRNFIQPHEFPYDLGGLIFQDNARLVYDSGDYPEVLARTLERIDYARWPARQAAARRAGRSIGLGLAFYVEGTGIGPYEGCRVTVESSGKVYAATSVGTQGQGHFTVFAQIIADALGVDVRDVAITTGDSGAFGWGTGAFASRAAVVAGNAVALAAKAVREKTLAIAATMLEARPDDLELAGGRVFVRGAPARSVALGQVAVAANPLRGTIPPDWEGPGLEASRYFAPPQGSFASGCHAAIIEIDRGTGAIRVDKYVVVHDCGKIINPMIVEGQIRGGVAQGIGNAFYEKLVYDETGQLLTQTFMDYLLPTLSEVPVIEIGHIETPSPLNPLGVKGAGEAGVIPVPAVFASALDDALGTWITEMPLSVARLLDLLRRGPVPPTHPQAGARRGAPTRKRVPGGSGGYPAPGAADRA